MATKKSAVKDLTNGSPVKLILGFALPLLLGMLFQQFYSMVDTIIVGKFLGAKALAAVGSTGSINFMIVGFCMGVCSGFAIPVAQMFGAGDRKALCRYVGNGAVLAGILSVVMTVLVCIWCRDILILMKTPSDILDGAYAYIFVIFLGIPLMVLYNQTSAIMRSLGDSRSPLIFLGISSILNIVLDLALVRPMGVAGTAWATIIAQGVSGFLCLFYMKKKFTILAFTREDWKLHKHYVLNLCNMGIQSPRSEVLFCRPLSTALVPRRLHLLRLPVKFPCSAAARSTRSAPLWRRMPDRTSVRRRWIVSTPVF